MNTPLPPQQAACRKKKPGLKHLGGVMPTGTLSENSEVLLFSQPLVTFRFTPAGCQWRKHIHLIFTSHLLTQLLADKVY